MVDLKKLKFITQKDDKEGAPGARPPQAAAEDVSVTRKVDEVIAQALAAGASEIHFEAFPERTRVRIRVGNQLQEQGALESRLHANVINRIKVLGGMDITRRGIAQKGYFKVDLEDRKVDMAAVIIPTPIGEKAYVRIHYTQALQFSLDQLGMYPQILAGFKKALERPNGLVLIAGPPGSGRTTTAYTCLQHLNAPEKNMASFETTIRYQVPGVIQGKPDERFGFGFIDGLRAMLDQEPDVLYVGDLNNDQAARMTLGAAFGKRIVIGRINAGSGATALLALLDMGMPGFLVASGVIAVLTQRLVRRLCERCRQPYAPTELVLGELGIKPKPGLSFFAAKGCEACGGTGFSGYLGLFELFTPNEKVQEKLIARAPAREIQEAAAETGLVPLRHDGIRKVSQGLTTLEEVLARL